VEFSTAALRDGNYHAVCRRNLRDAKSRNRSMHAVQRRSVGRVVGTVVRSRLCCLVGRATL